MLSITDLPFVQKACRRLARHGWRNTLRQLFFRLLKATVQFRILRGLHLDRVNPAHLECDGPFSSGFQPPRALRRFASEPANEISPRFVAHAMAQGDQCYAVCEGARLVSSGWYSTRPTSIGSPELVLHFDPQYVYMYKGLTREPYRGQRLYAVGVSRALDHYLRKGARGFVSYAEVTNLDSLKASFRMGYRHFGSIYLLRLFGRQFAFASAGCRAFGFRVEVKRLVAGTARGNRPQRFDAPTADAYVPGVKAERPTNPLFWLKTRRTA